MNKNSKKSQLILLAVISLLIVFALLGLKQYIYRVAILCGIYAILALGLNLSAGVVGQVSLGQVAFYGIGAYTSALLGIHYNLPFLVTITAGTLLAGIMGFLIGIPSLKLSGGYLAIITLGFGEIIRIIMVNWIDLTRGPMGLLNIPRPVIFGHKFEKSNEYYLLLLVFGILIYLLLHRVITSKFGRNLKAIKDDEIAAESIGVNAYGHKIVAYTIAAAIAGFAGSFYAHYMVFIDPASFVRDESTLILTIVVLGGMKKMYPIIVAAVLITALPEVLRSFNMYRMFIYGVLLVVMMESKTVNWKSLIDKLGSRAKSHIYPSADEK